MFAYDPPDEVPADEALGGRAAGDLAPLARGPTPRPRRTGKIFAVKQRYIRVGDELTDDVTVVVRGGALDPELLRQDALRNHAIYGAHGISVFAVRDLSGRTDRHSR